MRTNSDKTEGRGQHVWRSFCRIKATAVRLATGADVQGTDGTVIEVPVLWHEDLKGVPFLPGTVVYPTLEDEAEEERMNVRAHVLQRALDAGLSKEDIDILRGKR